jgi:alpha-amylase/alpha-mannosidase (GH57 family)
MGYVCIHGHFYQPPRENPWLEAIELQDSAYPYHDWNERVTAECYSPNAASRVLDADNCITKIINNYAWLSFNFGPTLLSWLENSAPKVYKAILDADRESAGRFSGHGSALAQAYNHMIMPLANTRDKMTQVIWGIRDFHKRFGRPPEGMWLPETAVDLETLDVLAQNGIRFTILASRQAARVRRMGSRNWRDVSGEQIDPTMAYRLRLPSRRFIQLFFYDGPISRAVAFEGLLDNGERFAERLVGAFSEDRAWPEIVHIATDGETYGHHHWRGEMALTYALEHIKSKNLAEITNYGEYLEHHPPTHDVEIFENTSWSCIHGIERWRSDCGCNAGHADWNQAWRAPLREALDALRNAMAPCYEKKAREFLKDPWAARDEYIDVILDRSQEKLAAFLAEHSTRNLSELEITTTLKLLELQRHLMLMYTSCGWFFDELSGLETVQVIQYAGRAVQLSQELFGDHIEESFRMSLMNAKSNVPEFKDGTVIYDKFVKPAAVNLEKVAAHYAISSLFKSYAETAKIYCYSVQREEYRTLEAGNLKLNLGRARFTSDITHESKTLTFTALHFGDQNLSCAIGVLPPGEAYGVFESKIVEAFSGADIHEVLQVMGKELGEATSSLRSMFRDDQRAILKLILNDSVDEAETAYRQIFEHRTPLIHFLRGLGVPLPKAMRVAVEFALNSQLRRELGSDKIDAGRLRNFLDEARADEVALDSTTLEYTIRMTIERLMEQFAKEPGDPELLGRLVTTVGLARTLPFEVGLWTAQNLWYEMSRTSKEQFASRAQGGDDAAREWVDKFHTLGEKLAIRMS